MGSGLVLAAVSPALLTSGCDTGDGLELPGLPDVAQEPDHEQVQAALRDEQAVLTQLRRVQRRHRELRGRLEPSVQVHRAHVMLLARADDVVPDIEVGGADGAERVPDSPADALAAVVRSERELSTRHVQTAMASGSGVLARVVASMSAAAAQQAAALTTRAPETSAGPDEGPPS